MQLNTQMAYQGSAPGVDDTVSYTTNTNNTTSRVAEDTMDAKTNTTGDTDEKVSAVGEKAVSIQSNKTIRKAVEEINQNDYTEAIFGLHDATNHMTIKIIDKETREVLREYPPEQTLDMIAKVWEAAGILVDEKL